MKIFAALLVVGVANALKYFPNHEPLSDQLINFINDEIETTWTAGKNFETHGMTTAGLKRMCGVIKDPNNYKLPYRTPHELGDGDVPAEFDARTMWSNCKSIT